MIENQYNSQPLPSSSTINDINGKENQRVIRKFINSAIYVEKSVNDMLPLRKTSPLSVTDDSGESEVGNTTKQCSYNLKPTCNTISKTIISRISKSSDGIKNKLSNYNSSSVSYFQNIGDENKTFFCQEKMNSSYGNISQETPESGYRTNDQSSDHSSVENSENSFQSKITVRERDLKPIDTLNNDLRLSLSCLNTNRTDGTSVLDPKEKQEIIQNWLAKKESEQKRKVLREAKLVKQKEEERQRLIIKERETFKKWLEEKKKEEGRKKIEKELEEQALKLKEAEKEKRKIENEISFNLWLRRKKKYDLERKIREKLALLHIYEERKIRMEENEKAYQEWLKNSKTRQKPVPMNRGLQSLCSSTSVTYINPLPWTPNIEPIPKPYSQ